MPLNPYFENARPDYNSVAQDAYEFTVPSGNTDLDPPARTLIAHSSGLLKVRTAAGEDRDLEPIGIGERIDVAVVRIYGTSAGTTVSKVRVLI